MKTIAVVVCCILMGGCTFISYEYGPNSVLVELGGRVIKIDATNDLELAIKDLLPPGILGKAKENQDETTGEISDLPGISINYHFNEAEGE